MLNPLNAELNPISHLLTLAGAHHFVDISRIRVNMHITQKSSKISNDILRDSVHRLYEGIHYFKNIIQFNGILENITQLAINFLPVKNMGHMYMNQQDA
jgi:hypothetical protein